MKNIKIGSDPEVFIKDMETGDIMSIIGLLGGSKQLPMDIGEGCSCQEDNILAEFNIPPVTNKEDFIKHINYGKDYISTVIAGHGGLLHYSSSEVVSDEILSDDKAKEFGCEPSMNAVTRKIREVNICERDPIEIRNLRSSGFHIHIGYDNPTEDMNERIVLAFELMVSMPLVKFDNDEYHRRSLYGLHGEFRHKTYGVECRSLGGYFISNDDWIGKVYDMTLQALKLAKTDILTNDLYEMVNYCLDENNMVNWNNLKETTQELTSKHKIKIIESIYN